MVMCLTNRPSKHLVWVRMRIQSVPVCMGHEVHSVHKYLQFTILVNINIYKLL